MSINDATGRPMTEAQVEQWGRIAIIIHEVLRDLGQPDGARDMDVIVAHLPQINARTLPELGWRICQTPDGYLRYTVLLEGTVA